MFQLSSTRTLCAAIGISSLSGMLLAGRTAAAKPQTPPQDTISILIARHRTAAEAARRDDLNSMMIEKLDEVFKDSGKYSVYQFSATMVVLTNAVRVHALDVSDIQEPLKPASLHKIAKYLGARDILTFHSERDKTGIKTDVTFEEIAAQDSWRTTISNVYHTASEIGRRRLKLEEMVDVNVDSIAKNLGVNSHLLDNLHLAIPLQPIPGMGSVKKPDRSASPPATADGASTTNADGSTPGTTVTPIPQSDQSTNQSVATANPAPGKANKGKQKVKPYDPFAITPEMQESNGEGPQTNGLTHPIIEETISNADRALRYRRSGDLPNTILYLRHAIDEKPDDIDLRRRLIQAYQDDAQPELAVAEIGRSLRLDSKNASLFRIYGDALLSEGKLPEAMKAYKQAVDADPKDVQARIALGDMLQKDGHYDDAVQAYHDAAAIAPASSLPHRKLAVAACQKAATDADQYAQAITEIKKARSLGSSSETATYLADYDALMRIMQSRLEDILDQMDNTYAAYARAQSTRVETLRVVKDMTERATAASDFIDALGAPAGQEPTHALFQEGTASVLSSLIYLKSYADKGDTQYEDKLKTERVSARHDLTAAGKKLQAAVHRDSTPGTAAL